MNVAEFKARAEGFKHNRIYKRSVLSMRDGAGVFDRVLGSGKYRTVLEIGTYRGISAAYMAGFCERVITVDLVHGMLERNGEVSNRAAFWSHMGTNNIDLHLVTDNAEKEKLIGELDFDLAFIDGDHSHTEVAIDFDLTKRCGTVLFHDYDAIPARQGVFEFVNSLPRYEIEIMDIFALWRRG